jgi:AcrR family transcriptional regulator
MIEKGYAETSLTDLAKAAGMTVSHLLYYYASKELVLLDLADELNAQVLADVTGHQDVPPEERIHVLVDNLFVRGAAGKGEMGLVREVVALSMHRPELRERLSTFSKSMLSYLEGLYAELPRQPGLSALDSAEIASALWMGLFINIDFDNQLTDGVARRLYRRTLLSLANLDETSPPASRKAQAPRTPPEPTRAGGRAKAELNRLT